MIDGIKIKVQNIKDSALWLDYESLEFALPVSSRTGEVLKGKPLIADCNGLTFRLTPTQKDSNKYTFHVLGSLHVFKNKGALNSDRFTFLELLEVIDHLKNYHIDTSVSHIESIEYGVNIELPYPCETVFNSVVTMPQKQFTELRFNKSNAGKRADFSQYEFKIYDKLKAETGKASNLLRVEFRVKKQQFISKKNIKTLSDITDKVKMFHVGAMLLNALNDVIMCDFPFWRLDELNPTQKEKVLLWTNPKWWQPLARQQRYRAIKELKAFTIETQTGAVKSSLMEAVLNEWCLLMNEKTETFRYFLECHYPKLEAVLNGKTSLIGSGFEVKTSQKLEAVSIKNGSGFYGKSDDFTIKINSKIVTNKKTTKNNIGGRSEKNGGAKYNNQGQRVCYSCGVDISSFRKQAVYCSVRCKNKVTNAHRKRTKKQIQNVASSVSGAVVRSDAQRIEGALADLVGKMKA